MKKLPFSRSVSSLTLFSSFVFLLYTSSMPLKRVKDNSKVGDVIYSLLKPEAFVKVHGSGWMLMNGAAIPAGVRLKDFYSPDTLPDGRGVFIRGMNVDRTLAQGGDSDGNRDVGKPQSDMIRAHRHTGLYALTTSGIGGAWGNGAYSGNISASTLATQPSSNNREHFITGAEGGSETRPSNIALYTYVKVHQDN